jgi:hypothetical protein
MARAAKPKPDLSLVEQVGDGRLVAALDLLVARPDLGPNASTLVAAGDVIPAELADLPRSRRP